MRKFEICIINFFKEKFREVFWRKQFFLAIYNCFKTLFYQPSWSFNEKYWEKTWKTKEIVGKIERKNLQSPKINTAQRGFAEHCSSGSSPYTDRIWSERERPPFFLLCLSDAARRGQEFAKWLKSDEKRPGSGPQPFPDRARTTCVRLKVSRSTNWAKEAPAATGQRCLYVFSGERARDAEKIGK